MQRNQPLSTPNRNFFSLNRLHPSCFYPPIRVDFNSTPTPKTPTPSILPVYNHDSHFFTPTFLLPSEKTYFNNNSSSERQKFTEKVRMELSRSAQEREEGNLEMLSSESKYCQICQMKFEDYWQHVAEKSHERKMHLSQSNLHIQDLCQSFQSNSPNPSPNPNTNSQTRRPKTPKASLRNLERCLSEQLLKGLQANPSTQILIGNESPGL